MAVIVPCAALQPDIGGIRVDKSTTLGTLRGVAADFVARLGSRASVPDEVRSALGVEEYADLLAGRGELPVPLRHGRLAPSVLLAVLRAMARPPSAELNKARLAALAGIPPTTIAPYVDAVVDLGVVRLVPGARSGVAKRAVARPRAVFDDPAVARRLAGDHLASLTELGGRARLAPYLEGIVAAELLRQQETSAVPYRLAHLRERNGLEIDLLVEMADDTVYGIEVRTAAAFRPHQFSALEALAARAGSRFRGGIVLNTAPVGFKYRPGMWGLPISALWDWDV
jgi:predicted AAA+ superfamily ATPase